MVSLHKITKLIKELSDDNFKIILQEIKLQELKKLTEKINLQYPGWIVNDYNKISTITNELYFYLCVKPSNLDTIDIHIKKFPNNKFNALVRLNNNIIVDTCKIFAKDFLKNNHIQIYDFCDGYCGCEINKYCISDSNFSINDLDNIVNIVFFDK